jgi:hypothetical protein
MDLMLHSVWRAWHEAFSFIFLGPSYGTQCISHCWLKFPGVVLLVIEVAVRIWCFDILQALELPARNKSRHASQSHGIAIQLEPHARFGDFKLVNGMGKQG